MDWYSMVFVFLLASFVKCQDLTDPDIAKSTEPVDCDEGFTCVKFYLCGPDGFILTNGSNLLDPRKEGASCHGDPLSRCCRNPQKVNITSRSPRCKPGETCVPYYLCDGDNGIIKDGRRLLDARSTDSPCEAYLDICCAQEAKAVPIEKIVAPHAGCGWRNKDGLYFESPDITPDKAKFAEFPWMVAILAENKLPNSDLDVYKCGGSLIHPSVVITAAHCLEDIPTADIKVRAGEWDTQTFREPILHQDRTIIELIKHEKYDRPTFQNDIAMLILNGSFELKDNVQPACLPPSDFNFDSSSCFVSGWGKTEFGRVDTYQVILKKIDLPFVSRARCQELFRRTRVGPFFELHQSFVCAGGEKGKDACIGDGGSPLVCPIPGVEDRFFQAGIVAWGIDCGDQDVPGAYVNVAYLREWIDEKLSAKGINPSSYTP